MRTPVALAVLLALPLLLPSVAAQTVCVPRVGTCVSAGADDGTYARVCGVTCGVDARVADEHTVESRGTLTEGRAVADAGTERILVDVEQHDVVDLTSREDVTVLYVDAEGTQVFLVAGQVSDHPWVEADVTDQHAIVTSHFCFIANVDGTIVGAQCGDWLAGEITPVVENHVTETVNDVRNDPLVRCVTTRMCPI